MKQLSKKNKLPTKKILKNFIPVKKILDKSFLLFFLLLLLFPTSLISHRQKSFSELICFSKFNFLSPQSSYAQTESKSISPVDLDLAVFPPTAYLVVKPETKIEHQVLVDYQGTVPIYLTPQLVEFTTDGKTGQPLLGEPTELDFITIKNPSWQLGQPTELKPATQLQLVLEIEPSSTVSLDEQPLSLVLMAQPSIDVIRDGSRAQTSGAIASNIILSVQGDFQNLGELIIDQLQVPRIIDSFQNLKFTLNAHNEGRNAVAAQGEITLTHLWSGQTVKKWFIYPDVVLANNNRDLRGTLIDPADLESGQAIEFADFSYKPAFLLGPYEITVKLSDASQEGTAQSNSDKEQQVANIDQKDLVHQQTKQLFAFPFSVVGALFLGIVLLLLYHWFEQHSQRPKNKSKPINSQ